VEFGSLSSEGKGLMRVVLCFLILFTNCVLTQLNWKLNLSRYLCWQGKNHKKGLLTVWLQSHINFLLFMEDRAKMGKEATYLWETSGFSM